MRTTTVSDFTVCLKITDKMWNEFLETEAPQYKHFSPSLQEHLEKAIYKKYNEMKEQGYEWPLPQFEDLFGEENQKRDIEDKDSQDIDINADLPEVIIANATIIYDNKELLQLFDERGDYIAAGDV